MYKDRLLKLRSESELTQKNISKKLNISRELYNMYENEFKILPIKHLISITKLFNVSIDYLFEFTNKTNYKNNTYTLKEKNSSIRIKNIRTSYKLSQSDLAKELNCSVVTISRYENNKYPITTNYLYDLSKKFNISADYILGLINTAFKIDTPKTKFIKEKKLYKNRLIILRKENNLLQKDLAKILNIHSGLYSQYETENTIIPIKHLNILCKYFNISLDYFFEFSNIKNYKDNTNNINIDLSSTRIKEFRKEKKLTQTLLADSLNCSYGTIASYESKKEIISTPLLYDFCKKYNISADYLLGKTNNVKYLK